MRENTSTEAISSESQRETSLRRKHKLAREDSPAKDRPSQPNKDKASGNKNLVPWKGKCAKCGLMQPTLYAEIPWLYNKNREPIRKAHLQINCFDCGAFTHLFPKEEWR